MDAERKFQRNWKEFMFASRGALKSIFVLTTVMKGG